jgi:hypothetical protein
MKLANLIKKGGLGVFATATPATFATHGPETQRTVATVATVAVANVRKQAANDPAPPPAKSVNPLEVSALAEVIDLVDWRVLDTAYMAHHVNCLTCQAAGRGSQYSLRCGAGAALWRAYSDAAAQPTERNNQQRTTP